MLDFSLQIEGDVALGQCHIEAGAAIGPRPERSIGMISFTAEESGLLGSEYYAANPVWPLETTVADINISAALIPKNLDRYPITLPPLC